MNFKNWHSKKAKMLMPLQRNSVNEASMLLPKYVSKLLIKTMFSFRDIIKTILDQSRVIPTQPVYFCKNFKTWLALLTNKLMGKIWSEDFLGILSCNDIKSLTESLETFTMTHDLL